jgi:histidinol dehydrogenase
MLRRVDALAMQALSLDDLPDVSATMHDVRSNGDAAVARAAARFGDPPLRVFAPSAMHEARQSIDAELVSALENAAGRIRAFAELQRASLHDLRTMVAGFELSHRAFPVRTAGIYVPGGRYPLVSSLLMGVIPARVAGVERVVVCTPVPGDAILAAASIAGADVVYQIGGAQAIAAMAYGTESIPRVDTIAGPGNHYVAAAKNAVKGICGIDALAGPSEIVIIASGDADARLIAADLLAQAEHDGDACAALLTDDPAFAEVVDSELERQLPLLSTKATARASIERNGRCAILPLREAIDLANALAPEHLELQGSLAEALAPQARCFGALFVGATAAAVFGDYGVGPNHILPTGGIARFSGGLSVFTFLAIRTTLRSIASLDPEVVSTTALFAMAEGLDAHRRSALARSTEIPSLCS